LSHVDHLQKGTFLDYFRYLFRPFFRDTTKTSKNRHKRSRLETLAPKWPPKCSPGLPKGDQKS